MSEYSNDRNKVRKYKICAWYTRSRPGQSDERYFGEFVMDAYDRSEAISQFNESRWKLNIIPQDLTYHPMGNECSIKCVPYVDEGVKHEDEGRS